MNPARLYTRKSKGLDNAVWFFMCIMILLSLGLLSFFWIDQRKCVSFEIIISPGNDSAFFKDAPLVFSTSLGANKKITWDFGDGSKKEKHAYVSHRFVNTGEYYIKASIHSGCEDVVKVINIQKSFEELDNEDKIIVSGDILAGKPVEFSCTKIADSWTWVVKDQPTIKLNSHGEKATIIFPNAGTYTVQVSLNDDRTKSYTKDIVVTDNRVKPKPFDPDKIKPFITDQRDKKEPEPIVTEVPKSKYISDKSFKDKLNDVIKDDESSPPVEFFYKYLDRKEKTDVRIFGRNQMNFTTFYRYLLENGNLKITDVVLHRENPENKTSRVMFITVTISK